MSILEGKRFALSAPVGSEKGEKDNFRPDIEGLRGVAVLLVVLYHVGLLSGASVQLPGGFVGVDLFFVISGFLITGLLIRERERSGRISFARFYARRVRRILPAAMVVLLVTIPLSWLLVNVLQRPSAMQDAAAAALSVANIRFALTTDYFNPTSYSPVLHYWSLGVEEQFYFVWPALLTVVAWRLPRRGAGIALTLVVAISFVACVIVTQRNLAWAYYMLPTRAWQLAAGGLLAVGAGSLERMPGLIRRLVARSLAGVGWLALAALACEALTLDSSSIPYPGTAALLPTLAGVLLIASGPERLGPGLILRLDPIRFVGKISYSLYLWHWPVLILGGLYLMGPLQQTIPLPGAVALGVLSVLIAAASWKFVEEPFRRGQIPLPRPSRVVFAGVTAMAVVALVGGGFSWSAQAELDNLTGIAAGVTDTPRPTVPATPTSLVSLAPGATPTPTPAMTPALTPYPSVESSSHAMTAAIRPTISKAPTDVEPLIPDGCLASELADTPPSPTQCLYGSPGGDFKVALIGDSHGSALFPGLDEVAMAHGWRLQTFVKINCSFVDVPIALPSINRVYTECATWNDRVVAQLRANPPDLAVVAMSHWVFNINRADLSWEAQGRAMAREMSKLPASTRLVIVGDPPLPHAENVPACLSVYVSDYTHCSYPRVLYGANTGLRETLAASMTGALDIDLTPDACPGT
ncbi:MAG: acyltransferase family protein, partial [Candidatus Limnocylindrales bacterium]